MICDRSLLADSWLAEGTTRSPADLLRTVLGSAAGRRKADSESGMTPGFEIADLFAAAASTDRDPTIFTPDLDCHVVLRPGDKLIQQPRSGDILLCCPLDVPSLATVSVITRDGCYSRDRLNDLDLRPIESVDGLYVAVVESSPTVRRLVDRQARKIGSVEGLLGREFLILRALDRTKSREPIAKLTGESFETAPTTDGERGGDEFPETQEAARDVRSSEGRWAGTSNDEGEILSRTQDLLEEPVLETADDSPPLPDDLVFPDERHGSAESLQTLLKQGAYILRYDNPDFPSGHYNGTLRVEHRATSVAGSGDLYWQFQSANPSPSAGIPIFKRRDYRLYLRVTALRRTPQGFSMTFEPWRFGPPTRPWRKELTRQVFFSSVSPPSGYPNGAVFFRGRVFRRGREHGRMTLGWVSPKFRKATVEIDTVAASEVPRDNGAGIDWNTIFSRVGWELRLDVSDRNLAEPSGASWSNAELHAEMLARRDRIDLDREWRYHLICVKRLDATERGIMYDAFGGDSNNIPREGAAISSHWNIPNSALWGQVKGMRFGEATAAYFRTAVHEVTHAMHIYHPISLAVNHIMQGTNVIAGNATPTHPFPTNIDWNHSSGDQRRLRHLPDPWVRPGGIPWGSPYSEVPISPADGTVTPDELDLEVRVLHDILPLGAPARIELCLKNMGNDVVQIPTNLGLKGGTLSGSVTGPCGTQRDFRSLIMCMDANQEYQDLPAGHAAQWSETLLRGSQGALFGIPGLHHIRVNVDWVGNGLPCRLASETTVLVTPSVNDAHSLAAKKILEEPDTLLSLAISGDHLTDGIEAIRAAIDDPVLRPHWAIVEVKRLGRRFRDRQPDYSAALALVDATIVLSNSEKAHLAHLVEQGSEGEHHDKCMQIRRQLEL